MKDLRIITAQTREHLEAAAALFLEYAASLSFSLEYQGFSDELRALPGRYAAPEGCILLALAAGEAVGCVAVRPLAGPERTCEMKRLYVRPAMRGAALGRMLCEELIRKAQSMGYQRMKLDTSSDMPAAMGLYRSLGFTLCERYNDDPMPDTLYFERELRGP